MLGGNILPFAQGGMTTAAAKASNLTLVVAFTTVWAAAAVERCSSKCPVPQVGLPTCCKYLVQAPIWLCSIACGLLLGSARVIAESSVSLGLAEPLPG